MKISHNHYDTGVLFINFVDVNGSLEHNKHDILYKNGDLAIVRNI